MEINRNFYGTAETDYKIGNEVICKYLDKELNTTNYTLNSNLDFSISPSMSVSRYAPFLNSFSYKLDSEVSSDKDNYMKYLHIADNKQNNLQLIALRDVTIPTLNLFPSVNIINTQWGYTATKYDNKGKLCSAFKYYDNSYVLKIAFIDTSTTTKSIIIKNYDEFDKMTDKTNLKIVYVYLENKANRPVPFLLNDYNFNTFVTTKQDEKESTQITEHNNLNFSRCEGDTAGTRNTRLVCFGFNRFGLTTNEKKVDRSNILFFREYCEFTNLNKQYDTSSIPYIFCVFNGDYKIFLNIASTYGFIFSTDGTTNITDDNITSENIYIPEIDNNGYYTGNYSHGEDNKNARQVKEKWNEDINAPYTKSGDPSKTPDNNKYTDKMKRGEGRQSGQFNNAYIITESGMKQLQKLLNVKSADDTTPEIYKNLLFMGTNPMECINSITWFACTAPVGEPTNLVLGSYTTDIAVTTVQSFTKSLNMGYCDIKPIHENHDFLNYEPYTFYQLYIPLCGWSDLDARKIMGKTIQLYMNLDFISGTCQCEVWINNCIEKTLNGIFSAPVSVQAFSQNDYINSRINNIKNIASDVVSTTASAVSANVAGVTQNAINLANDVFTFARPQMKYNSITANTANLSTYNPTLPYIARYSVIEKTPENYAERVGYACEFTSYVNSLSGYAIFNNFNCNGISATDEEKKIIKNLAEKGIYI